MDYIKYQSGNIFQNDDLLVISLCSNLVAKAFLLHQLGWWLSLAQATQQQQKCPPASSRWAFSYLYRITGSCFILQPTFLCSSAKTISGVRSKKPMSRFQLVPHLQWNSPVNCCFILRPQFGQICLLAPHIALLELCKDFFSRHTAGK